MSEDLRARYGRRSSSQNEDAERYSTKFDSSPKDENEAKYGRTKIYTKKTRADKEELEKEKDIKNNIQDVIYKYSVEHQDLSAKATPYTNQTIVYKRGETKLENILKNIISCCVVITVICLIVAFMMRPQINIESGLIIEKIKKAEDIYYNKVKKYHYFSKTNYDHTLGIDLSKYKYFNSYEVVPDTETGNYLAKIYGATNAFTITYYALKSWIKSM